MGADIGSEVLMVIDLLRAYPEMGVFATIAFGCGIGSLKFGAFSIGPVAGSLFAGLIVGQFVVIHVSGMTKSFLCLLFL